MMRDFPKDRLEELTASEAVGLVNVLWFMAEEVNRYLFPESFNKKRSILMSDITAYMNRMNIQDLLQLRDFVQALATKREDPRRRCTGMTVAEAAAVLGISRDAVRKRIARGTIEAVKEDGLWKVFLDYRTIYT